MFVVTIILLLSMVLCTFIAYKLFNPDRSDPMDVFVARLCAGGTGIVIGLFLSGFFMLAVGSRDADYKINTVYTNGIDASVNVSSENSLVAFDNDAIVKNDNHKESLTSALFGARDTADKADNDEISDGTLTLTKDKAKLSRQLDTIIVNGPLKNAKVKRIEYGTRKLTYKLFGSVVYDTSTETVAKVTTAHTGDYSELDNLLNK